MNKSEVKDFAQYEVYELIGEEKKYHCICVCKEYKIAKGIAITLANIDKDCDKYYVTSINNPGDLVPGGGWYDCWYKDKETGKIKMSCLS